MMVFLHRGGLVGNRGKSLSDYSEGDVVKLNESDNAVEFYVAKHDYESGLNGPGRTLLVRKECRELRFWNAGKVNTYATSAIDSWNNNEYKSMLEAKVQTAIGSTKFRYVPGNKVTTTTTLDRSVFLLGLSEFGISDNYATADGATLPIADILRSATLGGSGTFQWTRTPSNLEVQNAFWLYPAGNVARHVVSDEAGVRPCFTLPGDFLFDPDTNEVS